MRPSIEEIRDAVVAEVAKQWDVPEADLRRKTRLKRSAEARMVAYSLTERLSGAGPTKTAAAFGISHKSIIHSRQRVADFASIDAIFATRLERCMRQLGIKPVTANRVAELEVSRMTDTDRRFTLHVVAVLTQGQHRAFAEDLRLGKKCIRYTNGGGLEVVPV